MKKRILLTGASGYVGSNLKSYLTQRNFEIVSTDIWGEANTINGDLTDSAFVKQIFEKYTPDIVIHAAAIVPLVDNAKKFQEVNIDVTRSIASEAAKSKVQQFVLISSSAPYGVPKDFPITKDTVPFPIEPYGSSKLLAEKAANDELKNLSTLSIIRPRTIIGPDRYGIFEILFRWAKLGYLIPLPDGGNHYLQFVHIKDLCALVTHLVEGEISGIWPAGAPEYQKLNVDLEKAMINSNIKLNIININGKVFRMLASIANMLKISPLTKWHYGTLHANFAFDKFWKPEGFDYHYSNQQCIQDALATYLSSSTLVGESPHTKAWPTLVLDKMLAFLSRILVRSKSE